MQGLSTLISSASDESALKDTQVDEYYNDIDPDNFEAANISIQQNPYPGLRPFKATESIVFYGREGISSELVTRLAACRFLAVLGSSGTGKSSLIRAGLLPVLETLPGKNGEWKVVICRPGKNPFGNLARAIFSAKIAGKYSELEIWKILSSSSFGYQELHSLVKPSDTYNTLIVVDQFEELFRYRNDYGVSGRNDAALFVKMLIEVSQNEKLKTYVLITMRSEYLGDCVQLPQLVDAINNGQYLVPRLKPRQLIDVITEPAIFNCASVEDGFASKLIGEIGDSMDQLPVLQHVLRRAYEVAGENKDGNIELTYKDYEKVGKMESALDRHAKEVYDSLTAKQQEYCKILFQSITDRTTDGRGIRRPLTFSTLLNICKEKEGANSSENQIRHDLETVINSFRRDTVNFLMPPPHVPLKDDLEIDISHESLMRIWKDLQLWIEEEAKDASLLEELLERDKSDYIKGGKLIIYKEWLQRKKPGIAWATLYKKPDTTNDNYNQGFNDAIALIDKSGRKQSQARLTLLVFIAATFLLSIVAAAINHKKNTELQTNNDLLKTKDSILKTTYDTIIYQRNYLRNENDIKQGLINSLEAAKRILVEDSFTIHVKLANKQNELNNTIKQLELAKQIADINLEHLNKATKDLQQQAKSLKLAKDSATNLKNLALAIRHSQQSLAIPVFDTSREDIKAQLALKAYQLYQESGQEEIRRLQPQVYSALYYALRNKVENGASDKDTFNVTSYKGGVDNLAYTALDTSQYNKINYLTAEDKNLYSFDFANREKNITTYLGIGNKIVDIETSHDRKWIALNTLSKKLLLINNYNHRQDTFNLSGIVRVSKFSVDNATLYTYTQDSVLTTITVANRARSTKKIKFKIEDIAVSKSYMYGLTTNGNVIRWDIRNGEPTNPFTFSNPNENKMFRGTAINCTYDDSLIIWGNEGGQVFYTNSITQKPQYLTRFKGPVTNIAFNDSSRLVAVASYDKTIQVFSLKNSKSEVPIILDNNEGPVTSLFFQKEEAGKERLIAVISPGVIRAYPMDLETLACKLYKFYKDNSLPDAVWNRYLDTAIENKEVEIKCK